MNTKIEEKERKFEAAPSLILPPLDGLPQVADVSGSAAEASTAEYYDTSDLRLIKAGITLWRTEGGAGEGWQLTLPRENGASSHRELRAPLGQPGDPVPSDLAKLVRAYTRDAELRPVARLETRRRRTTLRDSAGNSLAEVTADEVAAQALGPAATLSRWNEVDVALTGGEPRLLRAAGSRLRDAGLRPAEHPAGLRRALAADLPQAAPGSGQLAGGSPSGAVVLAYFGQRAARLKALDIAVRRDEPDAIHQMRVTTRRLRSALQSFSMIWPSSATARLKDELKWFGQVLGDARDTEVLSEYFRGALGATPAELVLGPAQARISAHFAPRQAAAGTAVLQALDSRRYFAMLDEIDRLLAEPPRTPATRAPASEILPAAVTRAYRRTRRRIRRARRAPAGPAREAALHEARKAAKRARYAAEAVAPACGKKARRFAKRMKAVQSVLGDHHDAVTARGTARDIGVHAHLAGENAFSFGLLHERAHRDALEHQRQARRAWKRAKARKSVSWLVSSRKPAGWARSRR
jgi:CHAD domain-containing protein